MPLVYPITLHLAGKLCLVVGGGPVAERKALGLLEAAARVRVVSPTLTPTLQALSEAQRIETLLVPYDSAQLADVFLVFAATNHREVNARIAADAGRLNLLVNVADAPDDSAFLVPSTLRRGELCISISTGGNNPTLAARLGDELEARFGPEYGAFVELLGQMRDYIKKATDVPERRRAAHAHLLDAEADLRALLREGKHEAARSAAEMLVEEIL